MADGEQITNGLPFPAADSIIDLANVYSSAEYNFIPIQVLDYGQNEYNSVVAERDAKLTLEEVAELRPGSTMIEVAGGKADITMTLEETSDLSDWSIATTSEKTIEVDAPAGTRFYRFKMTE